MWDYADGMQYLRYFWDAAVALDPASGPLDEAIRFPICEPDRLTDLFEQAGLSAVESGSVAVATPFSDFDDYWAPFLRGQGPAPTYVTTLSASDRAELEGRLSATLPRSLEGTINLSAKAWTVTGSA